MITVDRFATLIGATPAEGVPALWDVPGRGELTIGQMYDLQRQLQEQLEHSFNPFADVEQGRSLLSPGVDWFR